MVLSRWYMQHISWANSDWPHLFSLDCKTADGLQRLTNTLSQKSCRRKINTAHFASLNLPSFQWASLLSPTADDSWVFRRRFLLHKRRKWCNGCSSDRKVNWVHARYLKHKICNLGSPHLILKVQQHKHNLSFRSVTTKAWLPWKAQLWRRHWIKPRPSCIRQVRPCRHRAMDKRFRSNKFHIGTLEICSRVLLRICAKINNNDFKNKKKKKNNIFFFFLFF